MEDRFNGLEKSFILRKKWKEIIGGEDLKTLMK
jgi:hypothetical protein